MSRIKIKIYSSESRLENPYKYGKYVYSLRKVNNERFIIPYTPYYNNMIITDRVLNVGMRFNDLEKYFDVVFVNIKNKA